MAQTTHTSEEQTLNASITQTIVWCGEGGIMVRVTSLGNTPDKIYSLLVYNNM